MSWVAAAVIGSNLVGGMMSSNAQSNAANLQAQTAQQAAANQMQMFNTTNAQQQPWIKQGSTAINQMGAMTAPGSAMMTPMTSADLQSNLAPNYNFQLQQGLGAVNNQQNANGGLVSGNSMKAINDYAQNYAGNAYQNAFNNYNTSQSNIFNRLASIAGVGQQSVNSNQNAGLTAAGNAGTASMAGAAAQAAGNVGSANAMANGLNGASSMYMLNNMMQNFK